MNKKRIKRTDKEKHQKAIEKLNPDWATLSVTDIKKNYPLNISYDIYGHIKVNADVIIASLQNLTQQQQAVFRLKYILNREGRIRSQAEVGAKLKINANKVAEIQKSGLARLKELIDLKDEPELLVELMETIKSTDYDIDQVSTSLERISHMKTDIKEMRLSPRAYNALTNAGYKLYEDLEEITEEELRSLRNLGDKSAREIIAKMNKNELKLAYDDSHQTA